jgi:hypothetical protein
MGSSASWRRSLDGSRDPSCAALGRTVAVAGHRTTYLAPFAAIDELRRGQPIVLTSLTGSEQ